MGNNDPEARDDDGGHGADHRVGLLPKRAGRLQITKRGHADKLRRDPDGARQYQPRRASGIEHGHENLLGDWHDKAYGIWRNQEGRHRRLDLIIVAFPEELPFARLTWTGSRTLNRLMRQRAIHLGLHLTANGLCARPPPGVRETQVVLDARPGHARVELSIQGYGAVPSELLRTEEAIIRLLACGTDAFAALYDPRMRNA